MRCQQKTACITLVFFSFYPALAEPQSQKSQIWRVPVVSPEMPTEETLDGPAPVVAPDPVRARTFRSLLEPDGEERLSAHSSLIDGSEISIFENSRSALRRAGISVLGSETSTAENAKLSLRASPGQAPVIYIDSVPLSSGFSGSNPETLIPALAIRQIAVFPFISRGGMPRRGNSGSIDFRMRSGGSKKQNEFLASIAEPRETLVSQLYSPPCRVESFLGCPSTSWLLGARNGLHRVRDDNNTPLVDSDDSLQPLKHNSSSTWAGHFKLHKVAPSGGIYETSALLGLRNSGLNGLPVSSSSPFNNSRNKFTLLSHSGYLFSPLTGNIWEYGLSGRSDDASFGSRETSTLVGRRQDDRHEQMIMGRVSLNHPIDGLRGARIFTSGSFEHNDFESRVELVNPQSDSSQTAYNPTVARGSLEQIDFGGGAELTVFNETLVKSELFVQWSKVDQHIECGVFAPRVLCESQLTSVSRLYPGGALELQKKLSKSALVYGLAGRTVRLPRPLELMGRPDGIAPNRALLPESSDFFEFGVQNPFVHMGAFFGRDLNLITLEQVSPYLAQFANRPQVRRSGFFSTGEARFGQAGFELSYERVWVDGRAPNGDWRPVPYVPASQTSAEVSYQGSAPVLGLQEPRMAAELSSSGAYFLDRDATYLLLPPLQLEWMFGGVVLARDARIGVDLKVRNLLNNRESKLLSAGGKRSKVGWSYLPALPLMGRSVLLSLSLKSS